MDEGCKASKKGKSELMVDPAQYFRIEYDNKGRFISYWHQINEIMILSLDPVLEIGIGNAFVANYLKQRGIDIATMDIDDRLGPDSVGSVLSIPFSDGVFKVVACFEVLEHLPYEDFPKALCEIYRVLDEYALLSLPDSTRAHRMEIWIPKMGVFKRLIELPWIKGPKHVFDGEHHWEIGKCGYPLRKIIGDMEKAGFEVEKTFRVFEHSYHRFFKLKKKRKG
ncbi:MAG: class I SAM-dependent methyltransferase [Anaerolineales bacterium]|nr:class I SAM-dependent methyltransferase [Anaerolineales bacterium]